MLISREENRFDFQGACFDLGRDSDRELLGWIFNQFLYGEVTGIQCGHWLYHAPHLNAAAFLARQAAEELSHVRRIHRILSLLGQKPGPAHPVIRFLSTGMMGKSWGEHVALEMALGEGLVLPVFYAMADTIPDPEIRRILESAAFEEERHVEFGERETQAWLRSQPGTRRLILAQAIIQAIALGWFKRRILRRIEACGLGSHPVLGRFDRFYDHVLGLFTKRIEILGLTEVPLGRWSALGKAGLLASLPFLRISERLSWRRRRAARLLTATYLEDPLLSAQAVEPSAPRSPGSPS